MAQINKPTDYFNTVLYTGNGSTQSITGVGFQPDWVWIKERNGTSSHCLVDSVRGATKKLESDNTNAEGTDTNSVTAFNTDGFSVGAQNQVNENSMPIVSWNWKANGSGSANTDGTISSTISVNTTAGFSIVKWTGNGTAGATVGHGLGSAPKVVITKRTDGGTNNWVVGHGAIGFTEVIYLNATNAKATDSGSWNNTAPSSTVFTVGSNNESNGNGYEFISYCFAEKQGFSKFGSYTGNGSTDGTFVYTGFKPAWVMIKNQTSGSYKSWSIFDTTRQTFNVNAGKTLYANQNYAEGKRGQGDSSTTIPGIDMLSNGFKCRVLNDEVNTTNDYIYMAFAEEPLVGSNNIPATAR